MEEEKAEPRNQEESLNRKEHQEKRQRAEWKWWVVSNASRVESTECLAGYPIVNLIPELTNSTVGADVGVSAAEWGEEELTQ